MTPELYAIIAATTALGGLVLTQSHAIRTELRAAAADRADLRGQLADIRERLTRLEGILEGIMFRRPDEPAA